MTAAMTPTAFTEPIMLHWTNCSLAVTLRRRLRLHLNASPSCYRGREHMNISAQPAFLKSVKRSVSLFWFASARRLTKKPRALAELLCTSR